jgi:hypothetical protein
MNFTDFRSKFSALELAESSEDPVFLRKLLRGAKVSVGNKQVPVNVAKVLAGIDMFKRSGKLQNIPSSVLPHYNAYLKRQGDLAAMFANRSAQLEQTESSEEVFEINENADLPPAILLKRKGIRIFPDGKKVAVYTNTKLNLDIAIPYDEVSGKADNVAGVTAK